MTGNFTGFADVRLFPAAADQVDMSQIEDELLRCLPDLRAYARSLTKNRPDADDLVQDAILRMLRAAHRYETGTNFKAWAFTILRNRFLNEFVAKRRHTREFEEGEMERVPVGARQEEGIEVCDFQRIFHRLPEDQRSILTLVAGSDLPYEDVARVLNCAVGTVKSRVHRARHALQALLEEERNQRIRPAPSAGETKIKMSHFLRNLREDEQRLDR